VTAVQSAGGGDEYTSPEGPAVTRYQMKQKWLCLGNDYVVRDDADRDVYYIDGRVFSLGQKLSFQDMQGNELAFISQRLLSWGPTYEIYRAGALAAVVKKVLFRLFHCEFTVDVPGPDDLVAEGDFWNYEYTFTRHGHTVAQVSKAFFSWTDSYGIEIASGEDDVLILAATVVIDLCQHQKRD
jgi:uncharacterized protein YxjI